MAFDRRVVAVVAQAFAHAGRIGGIDERVVEWEEQCGCFGSEFVCAGLPRACGFPERFSARPPTALHAALVALDERVEGLAVFSMSTSAYDFFLDNLAQALLAGSWTVRALTARARQTCHGSQRWEPDLKGCDDSVAVRSRRREGGATVAINKGQRQQGMQQELLVPG